MELVLWSCVFAVSIFTLIKASDFFTEYAEKIGVLLKWSPFVVGVLIVGTGTSIPELASGIIAALKGGLATAFVAENVVGSNIANILLIVGLGSVMGGAIFVKRNLMRIDLPILALSTALFLVFVMWDRMMLWYEAVLLLTAFCVYLWYVATHPEETEGPRLKNEKWSWKIPAVLILCCVAIYFGATYTVDSILRISDILGISSAVLVMTVVAVGTSLPELFVTISAVRKKNFEVALGNVFGSNIFNSLFIMGVAGVISPLVISPQTFIVGLPFFAIATLLYVFSTLDREVKNYEGALFLILYAAFCISIVTVQSAS